MMRKHELDGALTGASWVMISAFVTILIFPKNIAILSLIFMSIGDTVAGLAGRGIGRLKIGEKTVEGFLMGFLACALISYNYKLLSFSISIYGSLVGMDVGDQIEEGQVAKDADQLALLTTGSSFQKFLGLSNPLDVSDGFSSDTDELSKRNNELIEK